MIRQLAAVLLAAAALGGDGDGGAAPPERWTHPRGPASGSGRSHARAPDSFGGIAWRMQASGTFLGPPLTWDGVAFVVDGSAGSTTLVALDVETGRQIARTRFAREGAVRPAVYERSCFLIEQRKLVQFRLVGGRLERRWSYETGPGAYPPRILDGEVYLVSAGGLSRLRVGSSRPVWEAAGAYQGEPAVFGDHVYAFKRTGAGKLVIAVHARREGKPAGEVAVAQAGKAERGGRVVVTDAMAAALLPPNRERVWSILSRTLANGAPELKVLRRETLLTQPLAGKSTIIALTKARAWTIFRPGGRRAVQPFLRKADRPELVVGAPSAIALKGTLCFGTWAADLGANRILWHLGERKEVRVFAKGLRYNAVPAGHTRVLAVTRDGKTLCAFGQEEIGQ